MASRHLSTSVPGLVLEVSGGVAVTTDDLEQVI